MNKEKMEPESPLTWKNLKDRGRYIDVDPSYDNNRDFMELCLETMKATGAIK